jgi:hypothetical protein
MSWHVDDRSVDEYVGGALGGARAASLEAHLLACEPCRSRLQEALAGQATASRLTSIWSEVAHVVDAPRRTWGERVALRLGLDEDQARLLATAPALQVSWLAALVAVLAFAGLAPTLGDGTPWLLLVVAPLVPVLAVAGAYGRHVDPSHDMASATPYPAARLLMLRVLAVLVVSLVVTAVFTLTLSQGWQSVAWLLPALAMVSGSLVLARWLTLTVAAGVISAGYLLVVATTVVDGADVTALFGEGAGMIWAAVALGCLAILVSPPHRRALRRSS